MRCAAALLLLALLVAPARAEGPAVLPASGTLELAFSPWDDPESALERLIGEARRSLHVQAYVFTSKRLAAALIAARRRGVQVEVLADAEMHRRPQGNVLPMLVEAGIPVALETAYAAAHNKLLIVDGAGARPAVATGSYNFTWSAARRNAENLLILRDNKALAEAYLRNWQRHRAAAKPVDARLRVRPPR